MTQPPNRYGPGPSRTNVNGNQQAPFQTSPPQQTESDGPVRDNSIMNVRADLNSSLYQICLGLRRRLAEVPGFDQHIAELEEEEAEANDSVTDPVTSMWNCLRRGYPLMTIYNALQPEHPLEVDARRLAESNIGKAATFKFLQACLTDLMIPANECFLITDLYGGDTSGFVKVTKVVNKVLSILDQRGLLIPSKSSYRGDDNNVVPQKLTHRQNIVKEIVTTERTYVQHLEILQQFKNEIEEAGAIPGDAIHDIFLNLNALLDFQRRFLIRIEQQNSLPEAQQNWGQLFIQYKDSFRVYEPFIANQTRCNDTISREWGKLKEAHLSQSMKDIVTTQATLLGFLMKPFQRLSRYPMLLETLRDKGSLDIDKVADLSEGMAAAQLILNRANEAVGKEQRLTAVADLQGRVEDWKGHRIDHFGELLEYGLYPVVKGEGAKSVEREEMNPNKSKNRIVGGNRPFVDARGKPRLQLKGRIFMQNVTDVLSFVKTEHSSYTIQIFWKGDPGVENFIIRFPNEVEMNRWREKVRQQKQTLCDSVRGSGQLSTSETIFTSMRHQGQLENPYVERDDVEEDDDSSTILASGQSEFAMSRNASSNSLRSTATLVNQPNSNLARLPPPRFPFPDHSGGSHPLSLNTNVPPSTDSPGDFPGNSYFSPSADSPSSLRSSNQAGMYPFPRQGTPVGHWGHEESKHRTAPAGSAPSSRDGPQLGPLNTYQINGRTGIRPSLPVMTAAQTAQAAQQLAATQSRMRSASTPNIHDPNAPHSNVAGPRRYANGQVQPPDDNVPVPPIPSHMVQMRGTLNRSQTSSPTNGMQPARSATQSPMLQQNRAPRQHIDQNGHDQAQYQRQQQSAQAEPRSANNHGVAPLAVIKPPPVPTQGLLDDEIPYPSQLKVKIYFDPPGSHVTIVVPIIIKHRSLIDRIDSKMAKVHTNASISRGTARLRYKDQDDDFVTIGSDEDVQLAIEDWGQVHEEKLRDNIISDFELHWQQI
ncbi:MAG: hypothetical protein LQ342_003305 [Letrouitia transgressa]|nr:MAG: hypothetical protein LQ342_003305 [Letrouitia transgressa]